MQLFVDSIPLHSLGVLRVMRAGEEMFPDGTDAPQRKRVALHVRLDVFENFDFAANYALIEQVRTVLKKQNPVVLWQDESSGAEYLNQTATLVSTTFPEDNAWGTHHQGIEFVFQYWDHTLDTGVRAATFQKTGALTAVTLGNVYKWKYRYTSARFSPLRKHRSGAGGSVTLSGQFLANPKDTVAARRAALDASYKQMLEHVKGADGTLALSDESFSKVVRVEEFEADIDQECTAVNWSASVQFSEFPNEEAYVLAEVDASTREDNENGQVTLTFSGRVAAETEAAALTALASLRAVYVAAGFVRLNQDRSSQNVRADVDGDAFLEIRFSETYRKASGSILGWSLALADADDVRSGLIQRSYSGTVQAWSAGSWSAAYQTAVTKANELGDNKAQFKLRKNFKVVDSQLSANKVVSDTHYVVTVEFGFEYQLKGSKVYLEVTADVSKETFGVNQENVSGFVVAADLATAQTHYATVRAAYAARLIRGERTQTTTVKIARNVSAPSGTLLSPPGSTIAWGAAAAAVNTGETVGATYAEQLTRFDFSFSVFQAKTSSEAAVKYSVEVSTDYKERKKFTTVSGSAFALNETDCDTAIAKVLTALSLSSPTRTRRSAMHEISYASLPSDVDDRSGFLQKDFTDEFESALSGSAAILECECGEDIQFSGQRLVAQPVLDGREVIQNTGIQSGRRIVRGSVKATDETTAVNWAKRQYYLPFLSALGSAPATRYRVPPSFQIDAGFTSLADGVFRTGDYNGTNRTANIASARCGFSFEEILPNYDYQA